MCLSTKHRHPIDIRTIESPWVHALKGSVCFSCGEVKPSHDAKCEWMHAKLSESVLK